MEGYLGETVVSKFDTEEFKDFGASDFAMYFIEAYGQIDGDHHKTWVLDQVARILHRTPVIIKQAKWENGQQEYRLQTGEPSQAYLDWVVEMKDGEDGPDTYSYDDGCAP